MYKNSFVHYLTKIVVDILFYGGILACFCVPFFVKWWLAYFRYVEDVTVSFNIMLISSGALCVFILWQLKVIFKTMLTGNPFVIGNVICLRKMAVASFLIAVVCAAKCILYFTVASVIILLVFAIATLFCLTLKDVFKQAVAYKEENDWTV